MAFGLGKWDVTVDVVAVGSGLGGLAAAIVAHDAGKKVARPREGAEARRRLARTRAARSSSPTTTSKTPPASPTRARRGSPTCASSPPATPIRSCSETLLDTGRVAARVLRREGRRPLEDHQGLPRLPLPQGPRHGRRRALPRGRALQRRRRSASGRRRRTSRRTCPTASRTTSSSPGAASSTC